MKYAIIELQRVSGGDLAHLYTTKDTLPEAKAEFYRVMSAVAVSGIDAHSVILSDEDGNVLRVGNNKDE